MQEALVFWPIRTLDRTKPEPFPLEVRDWRLQWEHVPEPERQEILSILAPELLAPPVHKKEPNEGDEEATLGFARPDFRILKFRKYFVRDTGFDFEKCAGRVGKDLHYLIPVNLHGYFEDETGKEISTIDVFRFKTGEAHPVIPFDPLSVIQRGPALLQSSKTASVTDSNMRAHYLEIVEFLGNSSWYRTPPALTVRTESDETNAHSFFPNVSQMQEVAVQIRQLYARKDALFEKAINCYTCLCGDRKKVEWVQTVKERFDQFLDGSKNIHGHTSLTVRGLLDMFLYGAGIAHVPDSKKQMALQNLIATRGRAAVVMNIQMSFRRLVDTALLVAPVVRQDYHSWLQSGTCPQPTRLSVRDLLASKMKNSTGRKGNRRNKTGIGVVVEV